MKHCLPNVAGVIELFSPFLPGQGISGAVQAVVVDVSEPFALAFKKEENYCRSESLLYISISHKTTTQPLGLFIHTVSHRKHAPVITQPVVLGGA